MATSKLLKPTNVTISIPAFTDQPDQRVNSNCIDKEADAINSLSDQIGTLNSNLANKMTKPTNSGTQGQLLQNDGNGGSEWANVGTPSDSQVGTAVSAWLTAHPEATTTVQDGAITRAKLDADLKEKTDAVSDLKNAIKGLGVQFTLAGRISNDGSFSENANYISTDYINIGENSYFSLVDIYVGESNNAYSFYDKNKTYISGQNDISGNVFVNSIPSNARFVRFCTSCETWRGLSPVATISNSIDYTDQVKEYILNGNFVTPEMYGAVGDGETNDWLAIQTAIDTKIPVLMTKKYYINRNLAIFRDNTVVICFGEIVFDSDIVLIDVSSSYNTIFVNKITGEYSDFDNNTEPNGKFLYYGTALKLNAIGNNVAYNDITVQDCEKVKIGFDLYANGSGDDSYGVMYSKINFGIIKAMFGINFSTGAVNHPWINENTFTGGRLYGNYGLYTRKGTNQTDPYNGNKFLNIGFELLYQNAVDCEFFQQNVFKNIRMGESLFGLYWFNFASNCYNNVIECQSGVYFSQLNDNNNTIYPNIYKFNQIIYPFTWGSSSKTVFFGANEEVKKTQHGWCAENARFGTYDLTITGVENDETQHNLPAFGLYKGWDITINAHNGYGILNVPNHDGYGYGDCCHKINICVTYGRKGWFFRVNGSNKYTSTETGYFIAEYLNSRDWKVRKLADL